MGLLEQGAQWLEKQRWAFLAVPVEYHRQSGEKVQLMATIGRTVFRAENSYGNLVRTERRDFIVKPLPFEPRSGDWLLYAGQKYEVLAPNGEPVWRWSGTGQTAMRIHTKETGNAE